MDDFSWKAFGKRLEKDETIEDSHHFTTMFLESQITLL